MATILRTIFWNIISMYLCNLIETFLEFVHKDPMNNMPAFVQLASMSFEYTYLFKFMITNKISPEMS